MGICLYSFGGYLAQRLNLLMLKLEMFCFVFVNVDPNQGAPKSSIKAFQQRIKGFDPHRFLNLGPVRLRSLSTLSKNGRGSSKTLECLLLPCTYKTRLARSVAVDPNSKKGVQSSNHAQTIEQEVVARTIDSCFTHVFARG